eukprot:1477325-Rhodomonas_salina.1
MSPSYLVAAWPTSVPWNEYDKEILKQRAGTSRWYSNVQLLVRRPGSSRADVSTGLPVAAA